MYALHPAGRGNYWLSIKCAINWIASRFITATHHFVSFNTRWRFTCALTGMINGLIDCKLLLVSVFLCMCVYVCACFGVRNVNAIYGIIRLLALSNHHSCPAFLTLISSTLAPISGTASTKRQCLALHFSTFHRHRCGHTSPASVPVTLSQPQANLLASRCNALTELCDSYSRVTSEYWFGHHFL